MKVISLFSGAGGMDLGFRRAGFEIVWANDIYEDAVKTYQTNVGPHIHNGPIEGVSPVPDAELVIGGFPCQGFSVANRKRVATDSRNSLYLQFLRIITEKKPQYFVAENVKGIYSLGAGAVFRLILQDFEAAGYAVQHAILNAADYGVPQRRERMFMVGRRIGAPAPLFPPPPTHSRPSKAQDLGLEAWVGVGEALAGLPEPGPGSGLPNHDDFSTYKLRFNGHLGHRIVDPSAPAPTITARGDERGGVVVIHHPSNRRRVSPREAAVIQGFPENFVFCGTRTSAYRQIANAVAPPVAYQVAKSIRCALEGNSTVVGQRPPSARPLPLSAVEQLTLLSL